MIELPRAVEPKGERARQLISAAGLAVLFGTVWFAASLGQCEGRVVLVAGTALTAAGLVIAAVQRWRAMAHLAIVLGLAGQMVALGADLGSLRTWASLSAAVVPVLLIVLRPPWRDLGVTGIGASLACLLVFAATEKVGNGVVVWDLALAVAGGAGAALSLSELRRGRPAAVPALTTAAGVLICLAPLSGLHMRWMLVPGALIAGFGALYHQLDQQRSWPGPLMALLGSAVCVAVALVEGGGTILLAATLAGLAALTLVLAAAQQSRWWAIVGHLACAAQLVVLGAGHPLFTVADGSPWAPPWITWCVAAGFTALQLGALGHFAGRARLAALIPRWVGAWTKTAAVLVAGAAASTVLHRLTWPPLVTVAWAATALVCFRLSAARRWLTVVAGVAAMASLVKLVAWDWPALGLVTRLGLLLVVGTTLLVAPLFGRGPAESCRDRASAESACTSS